MKLDYEWAQASDAQALVELRIRAMQPSLEAVGRFDPERARQRFMQNFEPAQTCKLLWNEQFVGFYVLLAREDHLWLDHLYIDPSRQGSGFGAQVMARIKAQSQAAQLPVRLGALIESRANKFYIDQGFVEVEQQQWDTLYEWQPR
ncbi:MAG: GNAT family N-acetyltransferase [Pseudomonadales bacterium]